MKEREAKDQGQGVAGTRIVVEGRGDSEAEAGVVTEARLEIAANIGVEVIVAGITEEGVVEEGTTVAEGGKDPAREKMKKYLIALKRRTDGDKKKKKKRKSHSWPTSWKMLRH
jgi:hypothetical protein